MPYMCGAHICLCFLPCVEAEGPYWVSSSTILQTLFFETGPGFCRTDGLAGPQGFHFCTYPDMELQILVFTCGFYIVQDVQGFQIPLNHL